jgi:ribosomal protein S18 acetylase RimI-like enzyme
MIQPLRFVEITDANDDLLLDWLDLYETSFPPEEKVLVSEFIDLLEEKANGTRPDSHIQAALQNDRFVALLRYDLGKEPGIAYLWYIAVHPDARSGGIGSACFNEVVRRARDAQLRAVVFEVEISGHFDDSERRECARRRIEFYRRQGALLLTGIQYIQQLPHQPAIPLHIMVRPIEPVTPQDAFEMAQLLFDDVTQIAELELS